MGVACDWQYHSNTPYPSSWPKMLIDFIQPDDAMTTTCGRPAAICWYHGPSEFCGADTSSARPKTARAQVPPHADAAALLRSWYPCVGALEPQCLQKIPFEEYTWSLASHDHVDIAMLFLEKKIQLTGTLDTCWPTACDTGNHSRCWQW